LDITTVITIVIIITAAIDILTITTIVSISWTRFWVIPMTFTEKNEIDTRRLLPILLYILLFPKSKDYWNLKLTPNLHNLKTKGKGRPITDHEGPEGE
jgi:hypothetical protein